MSEQEGGHRTEGGDDPTGQSEQHHWDIKPAAGCRLPVKGAALSSLSGEANLSWLSQH